MMHLIFCLHRLPHLTRAEFQQYWREHHAPLVRSHAAALGVRRYLQAHTGDHPVGEAARASRAAPESYDGVAELWFDSADLLARMQTAAGIEASRRLLEDEQRFIDLRRSPIFIATDWTVIG